MDTDLLFVMGMVLGVFTIPSIASALLDGRPPRTPAILIIIGALMIGYAIQQKPGTYGFDTIPDTLSRVVARYF
jgi:uncharacterized membrane protein